MRQAPKRSPKKAPQGPETSETKQWLIVLALALALLAMFYCTRSNATEPLPRKPEPTLEGRTMGALIRNRIFATSRPTAATRPQNFRHFEKLKSFASEPNCAKIGAIMSERIVARDTGTLYTAYFTNDDACDGGNSYGFIALGRNPTLDRVKFLIQDGEIVKAPAPSAEPLK